MMNNDDDGIQDWRETKAGQARIQRARQFLRECTEEGEAWSIRYITLKSYYFSWCQKQHLLPWDDYRWSELYYVLVERSLVHYDPTSEKSTIIGLRMKHPVGLPRSDARKPLSKRVKKAVHARLQSNGNACALCGHPILPEDAVHIDHIQRVREAGNDDPANLQVVHARCNLIKG